MRIYTAHIHRRRPPVLVAEGFAWGALFFGPFWLLLHRAWIPAVIALAVLAAVCTVAPPPLRPVLAFGLCLILGLAGHDLRRWSLGLRRFRLAHVVAARNRDEAFVRLLAARTDLQSLAA